MTSLIYCGYDSPRPSSSSSLISFFLLITPSSFFYINVFLIASLFYPVVVFPMMQTDTDPSIGLNLNLSMHSLAKPLSQFFNDVSKIEDNHHPKLSEIDGYVGKLEEERRKIEVFKRELPLCMILLTKGCPISLDSQF